MTSTTRTTTGLAAARGQSFGPRATRESRRARIAAVIFALVVVSAGTGALRQAEAEDIGPELLDPQTVEPVSSAEFQRVLEHFGGKVVLVNLWATWCIPCVQELPELAELQKRYRDRGLLVVAVSLDDLETLDDRVRPFFEERAPGLISYISTEDSFTFVEPLDADWAGALPSSFFIDRHGTIRRSVTGRLTFRAFEREILPLLEDDAK